MEKPATMRVFLTGPNPSLLVAPGRLCDVIWQWLQKNHPDHVGAFFGLPQDQVQGRMLPLSRGASAAVNFGALCESAKPDVVISVGDDGDAAHVAATLMVGLAQFKWIHVLIDQERHQKRPYESVIDADVVLGVGEHVCRQASASGCRNVSEVSPASPILSNFMACSGHDPMKYFVAVAKNFEANNLFYLRDEWADSGIADDGWELVLAMNGADPGDFDLSGVSMPFGMRQVWQASSLAFGVPDEDMVDLLKFAWAVVDCSLNPSTCLMAAEAAHFGVGAIMTDCLASRGAKVATLLPSTPLKSPSGRLLKIPIGGALSGSLKISTQDRPTPQIRGGCELLEKISLHMFGRRERNFEVEVITPS